MAFSSSADVSILTLISSICMFILIVLFRLACRETSFIELSVSYNELTRIWGRWEKLTLSRLLVRTVHQSLLNLDASCFIDHHQAESRIDSIIRFFHHHISNCLIRRNSLATLTSINIFFNVCRASVLHLFELSLFVYVTWHLIIIKHVLRTVLLSLNSTSMHYALKMNSKISSTSEYREELRGTKRNFFVFCALVREVLFFRKLLNTSQRCISASWVFERSSHLQEQWEREWCRSGRALHMRSVSECHLWLRLN